MKRLQDIIITFQEEDFIGHRPGVDCSFKDFLNWLCQESDNLSKDWDFNDPYYSDEWETD